MKVDKSFLKKIIKEEIEEVLCELGEPMVPPGEEVVSAEQLDGWWEQLDDAVKMNIMQRAIQETAQEAAQE